MIAFVSNNGWVDGNTADGLRKTFVDEFSDIWVYNLRGNQRTAGEISKQEGGKVFGSGARTGVAVLIAAKLVGHEGPCELRYHGVPDYQTREEKLADIAAVSLAAVPWQNLTPNKSGDWLNQRNGTFTTYPAVSDESVAHFDSHSRGVETTRDAWCYNLSHRAVEHNMGRMIDFYNAQAANCGGDEKRLDLDPKRISWSRNIKRRAVNGTHEAFDETHVRQSLYRPFCVQILYFDPVFNSVPGKSGSYFPTPYHPNLGFYLVGPGAAKDFSVLVTDRLVDVQLTGAQSNGQFFPRWTYEKASDDPGSLWGSPADVDEWGYRQIDNITDEILGLYQEKLGDQVTKDDIFSYVYAVLHSEQYRTAFAADLRRMLPRIPLAATTSDFEAFVEAGRRLADLHVNYETVEPYPLHEQPPMDTDEWELYRVEKLRWADKTTKKAIVYNRYLTLGDIPAEAHRYMLGSRSALEWLIDRYQVKTDKASGIVNDPNDWCREHDDPRYIVDLIKRVTRVSVETMKIVDSLPLLPINSN